MEKVEFRCHFLLYSFFNADQIVDVLLSIGMRPFNVGGPATARDGWIEEFLEIELPPHAVAALTVEFAPS